jgi:hypothetical protein
MEHAIGQEVRPLSAEPRGLLMSCLNTSCILRGLEAASSLHSTQAAPSRQIWVHSQCTRLAGDHPSKPPPHLRETRTSLCWTVLVELLMSYYLVLCLRLVPFSQLIRLGSLFLCSSLLCLVPRHECGYHLPDRGVNSRLGLSMPR